MAQIAALCNITMPPKLAQKRQPHLFVSFCFTTKTQKANRQFFVHILSTVFNKC